MLSVFLPIVGVHQIVFQSIFTQINHHLVFGVGHLLQNSTFEQMNKALKINKYYTFFLQENVCYESITHHSDAR